VLTLGFPMMEKTIVVGFIRNAFGRKAPGVIFRQPVTEPLQTGIKQ
jgi:F0F1-type ATP synthase alpha subunit